MRPFPTVSSLYNSTAPAVGQTLLQEVVDLGLDILLFLIIVVGTYVVGRLLRSMFARLRRKEPTAGAILTGKVVLMAAIVVVAAVALREIFSINLLSLFATLGLVSLALGFGLQNTVANMAAGVTLSIDRPFQVGDRIRVGNTWGDVESIGLRSTRILTTSGEEVSIPNAVLDTQEVWNNTHGDHTELRLQLPFQISYDSSVQLAESIALRAARKHERVLAYPESRVQVTRLADSGIDMELRCWIENARARATVTDRLYRDILRDFDKEGINIPFHHEVQVNAADIRPPAPTPEFLEQSEDSPLVLVVVRGTVANQPMADPIIDFVRRIEARALLLHVRSQAMRFEHVEADKTLNLYMVKGRKAGIKVSPLAEVGDMQHVVARVARHEGARLVILGQSVQRGRTSGWYKHEVAVATRAVDVPVLPLQTHIKLSDDFIERWHKRLRPEPDDDDAGDDD